MNTMQTAHQATQDPITLEVVRNKLDGIANEMEQTLLHSAFSPIVKEGMDCSAALFTADGQTVSQADRDSHPPGDDDPRARGGIAKHPLEGMAPGDVTS
ncbi:MAG: hydantoinase B/oxoprolinase family protein [Betaproteobacteria bacterium]|nr:hydantoinase B/oxoprolinase family protein [Betaproteobacteria bacterium]